MKRERANPLHYYVIRHVCCAGFSGTMVSIRYKISGNNFQRDALVARIRGLAGRVYLERHFDEVVLICYDRFSWWALSDLFVMCSLENTSPGGCEFELVVGGGATGTARINWLSEKAALKKVSGSVKDFCHANGWDVAEVPATNFVEDQGVRL